MTDQLEAIGDVESGPPTVLLNPYPGLRPFAEKEQRLFFGRTQQINDILQRLERSSFALVTGGSGSGKSSIVNAGVIPALRKKQLSSRSDFWLVATFSPKDKPFRNFADELAKIIEPLSGQSPAQLVDDVELMLLETNSLAGFFARYESRIILEEGQAPESRRSANLLIFCDQFEEIFRKQNRGNPEADQLVNLLVEAYRNQEKYPRLYVIIGMRSEDLHRCAEFIDLPNVINGSMFLTRRLDETEMASAIVEPMRLALRLRGMRPREYKPIETDPWPFEVDILRRLNLAVSAVARDPDHLPLLQHLLSVLWRYLDKNRLIPVAGRSSAEYEKFRITTDNLAAALKFPSVSAMDEFALASEERHVQEKWNEAWILKRALDGAAEAVKPSGARFGSISGKIFRLLAELDDRGNYKRRWTSRKEIMAVAADDKATQEEVDQIIAAFSDPYPFLNVKTGPDGKIDVSHEAFIRNWTQFVAWLKHERHLSIAYDLLRTKYLEYQRMLADPERNPLAKLWLRLSNRLSNEQLVELADWKRSRGDNPAWASRYASGIRGEDPDFHEKSDTSGRTQESFNKKLLRYYQRSKLLSYSAVSFAALGVLALLAFLVLWLEASQQFVASNREVVAQATASVADKTVDAGYGADSRNINKKLYELTGSRAVMLNAQRSKGDTVGTLLSWYRTLTWRTDDPSRQYYNARLAVDKATRWALDNAVLPTSKKIVARASPVRKQNQLSQSCKAQLINSDELKNVFQGRDSLKDPNTTYSTWAPLEHEGGKRIVMAPTMSGNLVLLLLSEDANSSCTVQYLQTLSLPPGKLHVDRSLRLVIINFEVEKPEDQQAFVFRIWWTRRCEDGASTGGSCTKPFAAEITGPAVLTRGNYRILDENHLERIEKAAVKDRKRFELPKRHRPVLLSAAEAGKIKFPERGDASKQVPCAMSDRYAALIAEESGNPSLDGLPGRSLYIIEHAAPVTDCAQLTTSEAIAAVSIGDYSIRNITFSERSDNSEPEFVYLQGLGRDQKAAVYEIALVPKRMYCLSRDTNVGYLSSDESSRTSQYDGLLKSQRLSEADVQRLSEDLVATPHCGDAWGNINP